MNPVQLALLYFEQNNSEQALQVINKNLHAASAVEKLQIVQLLFEFGFMHKAKDITKDLLLTEPMNSDYKTMLADIYIELEEDDQAIHLLHDIHPDDENYLRSLLQLADLYQAQGLYEVAEQKLYEAKRFNQHEIVIDLALAELFFSIGKFNRCIPIYEQIYSSNQSLGDIPITARLATSYAAVGEYEKSFKHFESLHTEEPDLLFKHGLTAFHLERYLVSISIWSHLLKLDPYYYVVYYYLGKAYVAEGNLSMAKKIVNEGLSYDEHNDKLYYLAAEIAQKDNALNESKQFIERAIEINPDHRDYILFYITLLRKYPNDTSVIDVLEQLLQSNDYDPIFEWELAKSYNELDELEKALPHYQEAYKVFKEDVTFLYEYGFYLIELGKVDKAQVILKKYLTLEPLDEDTAEYLNRL